MSQKVSESLAKDYLSIFNGGGEVGALMRAFDWENHPLGSPENWPESLKNNIRLMINSGFPMFIWWSDDLFCFNNDAYIPALGKKYPEALGKPAAKVWAEIWHTLEDIVKDIQETGNSFYADSLLLYLERKGFSEETYWTFSYSPVFDDNGAYNGIFCACTEVTSTVFSERRLKSLKDVSEKLTQMHTLDQAGQLTCDILLENQHDVPFSMIYLLNGTATEATLIGKAGNCPADSAETTVFLAEADSGWRFAEVLAHKQPEIISLSTSQFNTDPEQGTNVHPTQAVVLPVIRPGQEQVIGFFITGISPTQDYTSDYKGFHLLLANQIATSITSIQSREELARQQEYLQNIFQQAPVGICIVSLPDYVIDLANPGVGEIWGRKQEDVLGKPIVEALPEVVDQGIIELLDGVVNSGEPFIANELPLLLERNGELEQVYLNFIYHPMRDSQGFVSGVIAVAVDITQQVRYRLSIEALNEELLVANADLDNFVYAASHDLKAPISNIEGLMNALADYLPEETLRSETVKRVIELIEASVNRFKKAVTDLTEVAKIQRESGSDVASFNILEVVDEVLPDFESAIAENNAKVVKLLAPDAVIRFSAKNIRSVIYNLISNALKYRSPDRDPIIQIATEVLPEQVVLSVTDNGLGFDQADESKIFSMFKRLHDHVEGSGIGLYIVKKIVENAGGKIVVKSKIGEGSTFSIFFKRQVRTT